MTTPEMRAYQNARGTYTHLDRQLTHMKQTLGVNIARSRRNPDVPYWRKRIVECRAEIARLEADHAEAKQAMEEALAVVRSQAVAA